MPFSEGGSRKAAPNLGLIPLFLMNQPTNRRTKAGRAASQAAVEADGPKDTPFPIITCYCHTLRYGDVSVLWRVQSYSRFEGRTGSLNLVSSIEKRRAPRESQASASAPGSQRLGGSD